MPSVYDADNFSGRVNYAATVIARRGGNTRHFDTCFEMWDGDEVAAALVRRADKNPNSPLARNIFKYLNEESVREVARRYAHLTARQLAQQARDTRAAREAERTA
jgi:hypothetical protein